MITRRQLLASTLAASRYARAGTAPLAIPILRLRDKHAISVQALQRFEDTIWNQAAGDFAHAGIVLQATDGTAGIRRYPSGRPLFEGLGRTVINLIVTDRIPMDWDHGRALAGISNYYEGFRICLIALDHAHPHRIPFLNVNTVVHELLHVLFGDIFVPRPSTFQAQTREARVDLHATRLWLFHDGAGIREAAQKQMPPQS